MATDNKGATCVPSPQRDMKEDGWSDEEETRLRRLGLECAAFYLGCSTIAAKEPGKSWPDMPFRFHDWMMAKQDWRFSVYATDAAADEDRLQETLALRLATSRVLSLVPRSETDLANYLVVWWDNFGPDAFEGCLFESNVTFVSSAEGHLLVAQAWRVASRQEGEPRTRCIVPGGLMAA